MKLSLGKFWRVWESLEYGRVLEHLGKVRALGEFSVLGCFGAYEKVWECLGDILKGLQDFRRVLERYEPER